MNILRWFLKQINGLEGIEKNENITTTLSIFSPIPKKSFNKFYWLIEKILYQWLLSFGWNDLFSVCCCQLFVGNGNDEMN